MAGRNPQTSTEWQEAVDAAAAARAIADCEMYGLLEGGPHINVARCDQILEHGRKLGVRPSKSDTELAVALVQAINAKEKEADYEDPPTEELAEKDGHD